MINQLNQLQTRKEKNDWIMTLSLEDKTKLWAELKAVLPEITNEN